MSIDRKKLYIISASILAALALTLFAPMGISRIIAAILLLPSAVICLLYIKKRVALSINTYENSRLESLRQRHWIRQR